MPLLALVSRDMSSVRACLARGVELLGFRLFRLRFTLLPWARSPLWESLLQARLPHFGRPLPLPIHITRAAVLRNSPVGCDYCCYYHACHCYYLRLLWFFFFIVIIKSLIVLPVIIIITTVIATGFTVAAGSRTRELQRHP